MDDYISQSILERTDIFSNIHPNLITGFGFIMNFLIFHQIYNTNYDYLPYTLFMRWLADCLDGNVARKYKKTSTLGNNLDLSSDIILIYGSLYLIARIYKIPQKYTILLMIAFLALEIMIFNALDKNKKDLNKKDANIFKKIHNFIIDNSYIQYIVLYFIVVKNVEIRQFLENIFEKIHKYINKF